MAQDNQGQERPKRSAKFIEDCNRARERGFYQFLRHLTQGFRWDSTEWCRNCLLDGWAWWKLAQLADQHDEELYQWMLEESRPEVEQFLEHSQMIRERHRARRSTDIPKPPVVIVVDQQPGPKEFLEEQAASKIEPPQRDEHQPTPSRERRREERESRPTGNPDYKKQRRDPEQEHRQKEKKDKENKQTATTQQPAQEEPSFLETTGKLIVGFGRWVATGKFQ